MSETVRPTRILSLIVIWLSLGFTLGTLALVGPVRWMTSFARAQRWSQGAENLLVRSAILLVIIVTTIIALRLSRRAAAGTTARQRLAIPAFTVALAFCAVAAWMNPTLMAGRAQRVAPSDTAKFVFGGYPDKETLHDLKRQGFTAVVTLLHPAVVPFEPRLLGEERKNAREAGIQLIEAPMLPWVASNESSLDAIRGLAGRDSARYYVHCYLGKDRVNVVRRMLERSSISVASTQAIGSARRLLDRDKFERGPIINLGDSVFVIPFPTDEEWYGYLLSGWVKSIASLLDPANAENAPWLTKEDSLARRYQLPVTHVPVTGRTDSARMRKIVDSVRALPRPVAVHGFLVPSSETDAFIAAYRAAASGSRPYHK